MGRIDRSRIIVSSSVAHSLCSTTCGSDALEGKSEEFIVGRADFLQRILCLCVYSRGLTPQSCLQMFTARKKIVKELKDGKEGVVDAFEEQVAQVRSLHSLTLHCTEAAAANLHALASILQTSVVFKLLIVHVPAQAIFDLQVQTDMKADLQVGFSSAISACAIFCALIMDSWQLEEHGSCESGWQGKMGVPLAFVRCLCREGIRVPFMVRWRCVYTQLCMCTRTLLAFLAVCKRRAVVSAAMSCVKSTRAPVPRHSPKLPFLAFARLLIPCFCASRIFSSRPPGRWTFQTRARPSSFTCLSACSRASTEFSSA